MIAPDDWIPDNHARVAEIDAMGLDPQSALLASTGLVWVPLLAAEGYRDAAFTLESVTLIIAKRLRSS